MSDSYIESNLDIVKHPKGNPIATPIKNISGLATVLKTVYKLAGTNPSHQYEDGSMVTLQTRSEDIYKATPKAFRTKYNIDHVHNAMRLLALASVVVPCSWVMLSNDAVREKRRELKSKGSDSNNGKGFVGLQQVYLIADLKYPNNLNCDRLNRRMTLSTRLSYLSIATMYDTSVASMCYNSLNRLSMVVPDTIQSVNLAQEVFDNKVITVDMAKDNLIRDLSDVPEGYIPPDNNAYFRQAINSLDAIGWLAKKGIEFKRAGDIPDDVRIPGNINRNAKVLFLKSLCTKHPRRDKK